MTGCWNDTDSYPEIDHSQPHKSMDCFDSVFSQDESEDGV